MANFTTLADGGTGPVGIGDTPVVTVKFEIDMADVAATSGFTTADNFTVLYLPADTYFELIKAKCRTTLTGITQIDVGDENDPDEFVSAATTLVAGTYLTIAKATHTDGSMTEGTGEVRVVVTGVPSTGIIEFTALTAGAVAHSLAAPRTYPN